MTPERAFRSPAGGERLHEGGDVRADRDVDRYRFRARYHDLTAVDRAHLDAEAAAGDVLARLMLAALAEPTEAEVAPVVEEAAASITRALAAGGWVVVWSSVLGEEVVFTRDVDVQVPEECTALPRFDREELAVLAEQRPSVDRLRAIVDVKRELGGRVVRDTGEPLTPARELFPGTSEITNEKMNAEPVQGRLEARRPR